jgi:hypothetical protein
MVSPTLKGLRAPARVMKAEQTQRGRRIRHREKKTFV